jgi:hypothetical protein
MSMASVFTKVWSETKGILAKADAFLQKNSATIQTDVKAGEAALVAVVPTAAPFVSTFGSIEEAAMGEVVAAVHSLSTTAQGATVATAGQVTVTFSQELSDVFHSLVGILSNHPAVVAATAAAPVSK